MKFIKPILIGCAAIGTTYLSAKGVSVSKAADNITPDNPQQLSIIENYNPRHKLLMKTILKSYFYD